MLKKKKIGNKEYYYLELSSREGKRVKKFQKYLGGKIPENLDKIKKEFEREILNQKYFKLLDKIKENFLKEKKKTPDSAIKKEMETFTTEYTYNTNAIEGSTLSLRETANLLEKGITPVEKPIREVKETLAHKKVFYQMLEYKKDLNLQIILYWHKMMFQETKPDISGKIREHQVKISGCRFLPPYPVELNCLLDEFFGFYRKNKKKLHPVELAALVHLKLVSIHPFSDGNGRISRLAMNFVLHKNKYPMLIIPYKNRNSYYKVLEKSQVKKDDYIFVKWILKKYLKEYEYYLK